MKRTDVYKLIDGEREYQEAMPQHQDKLQQVNTPIASWIIYMEKQLIKAKDSIYQLDEQGALVSIRKCTAIGVVCMEHNETLTR